VRNSAPRRRFQGSAALFVVVAAGVALLVTRASADPCADGVAAYVPGTNGGFQADLLPEIVTGPPYGGGMYSGSTDVVSLGDGGSITLSFEDNMIIDGPGVDFTVFENPFVIQGTGQTFAEVGIVSASEDGVNFIPFPYNATTFAGLAGVHPVFSNPSNGISPCDPSVSGGDSFDLATIGLNFARYVRIDDAGAAIPDPGNRFPQGVGKSGFDLDAIVAVHSRDTCASCCDVDGDGQVRVNDVVLLLREVLGPSSGASLCGAPPCNGIFCADANQSGGLDIGDAVLCLRTVVEGNPLCAPGRCDFSCP